MKKKRGDEEGEKMEKVNAFDKNIAKYSTHWNIKTY